MARGKRRTGTKRWNRPSGHNMTDVICIADAIAQPGLGQGWNELICRRGERLSVHTVHHEAPDAGRTHPQRLDYASLTMYLLT